MDKRGIPFFQAGRIICLLPLLCVVLNAFTLPSIHIDPLTISSTRLSSAINNVDWGRKTVLQLQKELRSRNLSDRGSKTDLIKRLEALNTVKEQKNAPDTSSRQGPASPVQKKDTPAESTVDNQRWVEIGSDEETRIENYLRKHKQNIDNKGGNNRSADKRMNTIIDVTSTSTPTSTTTSPETEDATINNDAYDNTRSWKKTSDTQPRNGSARTWKTKESRQFLSIDKDDFLKPYDAAIEMNTIDNSESSQNYPFVNGVEEKSVYGSTKSDSSSTQAPNSPSEFSEGANGLVENDDEILFEATQGKDGSNYDLEDPIPETSPFTNNLDRDEPSPFQVLGVEPGATMVEIKSAYRKKAMQYHPGNNLEVSGDTAENFRQLVEAFQVLSGGYKKGKYENEYRMLQRLQRRKEQGKTKDNNSENDNVSQNLKAILPVYLFEKLAERTGLEQPAMLPVQKEAYKALFSGLDVVLSAPSGSGKTLGFVLPLLAKLAEKGGKEEKETNPEPKSKAKRGRRRKRNRRSRLRSELDALNISCKPPILVLTPTSDVAKEVGKTCSRFHNNSNCVATIFDTPLTKLQPRILHNSDLDIVVGTPGSIKEYAKKGLLDFSRLKTIALDEADTILADPHGRSGIESILKGAAEDYQTILTSTTMTTPLLDFCREVMNMDEKDENFVVLSKNECKDEYEDVLIESTSIEKTRSPIVRHWHTSTRSFDRAIIALDLIATLQPKSCVVFISSQSEAEAVANILALSENTYVSFLSEESTDEARERAVERLRDSKSSVSSLLVTTDTASRDLEFPGVDLVLQFGIPRQPDNNDLYDSTLYANRTRCLGQFGSEAKEADAILLYDQTDEGRLLPGLQTEMEVDDGITINPRALPIPQNILERSYNHAKGICNSFLHLDSVVDCFEKQLQAEMLKLNAERREKELLRRLAVAMTVLSDQNGSNADGK